MQGEGRLISSGGRWISGGERWEYRCARMTSVQASSGKIGQECH